MAFFRLALISCLFCCIGPAQADHLESVPLDVSHPESTPAQVLKPGDNRLNGKVEKNDFASISKFCQEMGFTIKQEGKDPLPSKITGVISGSPAAKRGLTVGDRLIARTTTDDGSTLTVEHEGQGMRFTVKNSEVNQFEKTLTAGVQKGTLTQAPPPTPPTKIDSKTYKNAKEIFENHDLVLIIDRSGSMIEHDCPGNLSRWDWVCGQASEVAQAAAEASSDITAVVFSHKHETYQHLAANQIPLLFARNKPMGGTNLADPLEEQLREYFQKRTRPLIIVIITDGMPSNPERVAEVVRTASMQLSYTGEVTLTFLLIGEDAVDENSLLAMLGERNGGSVKNGGMVDIIPFRTASDKGIKQALFEELRNIRLATNRKKPSAAANYSTGQSTPYGYSPNFSRPGPGLSSGQGTSSSRSSIENALLDKYH
jgi:Mg-chelatase subunit ChlD